MFFQQENNGEEVHFVEGHEDGGLSFLRLTLSTNITYDIWLVDQRFTLNTFQQLHHEFHFLEVNSAMQDAPIVLVVKEYVCEFHLVEVLLTHHIEQLLVAFGGQSRHHLFFSLDSFMFG